jgi:hypothetical protein
VLENLPSPHGLAKDDAVRELLQQLLERRFVLTDRGGSVTRWSHPAESLLGWSGEGVLGRPLLEVLACERELPTDGGSCLAKCHRYDGSELELGLTFVPVPMSQSLEFTGMLETLEAGAPADVTLDRLHRRHSPVIEWMAACLAGEAHLEEGELSAGTIIAFRPTDESEWGEEGTGDAEPAVPADGRAEAPASPDFVGRVHEALQRSAALEEALDSASAALEEARTGSYEARDDARAARLEAAEAAARIGQLEQRNTSISEEL